jgi:DNA-binding transcriptional ArsR family regulator
MSRKIAGIDTRVAKALSHPIRVKALEILNRRVASPSDIARELELPVANVSYHINTLLRLQCIEEVETRHVRGAIEHLYRATRRPSVTLEEWEAMPVNARHAWATDVANVAIGDLRNALRSERFGERAETHFTWTRLVLDEQGWRNVHGLLDKALEAVLKEQAESAARLANGEAGGPEVRSMLSLFHYESPLPGGDEGVQSRDGGAKG